MDQGKLSQLLTKLIATSEDEVVEFKQAGNDYDTDKIGKAMRAEVNKLLLPKLSEALTGDQKDNKIANLLTNLRRKGRICNTGSRGHPIWKIAE